MSKKSLRRSALALAASAVLLPVAPAIAQDAPKLQIGGTTYTKWLYGNLREQGAMYNFTTIPGEGYGDNGQGTELELLLNAANLLLVTFDAAYADRLHSGQVMTLFVVTVAAAEVGVALAVVLLLFRRRGDVDLLTARDLGEQRDGRTDVEVSR